MNEKVRPKELFVYVIYQKSGRGDNGQPGGIANTRSFSGVHAGA